ncbi:MAG: FprA family A-type flavoprotein [Clostridia bacterium]|nr:FprA family A-type flavoprotein [Clostridia bacterium]
MNITKDIRYIGVNDNEIDLFEGQYRVPHGISYNSYVIIDERVCVFDTVDRRFGGEWLSSLEAELSGRAPDYLVVTHMEPDHSANIAVFLEKYPEATVVATAKAFKMMGAFFGEEYADRRIVVSDGTTLSLGSHELTFVTAPMVHWPEVAVCYDKTDRVLFSADAFGKFGAIGTEDNWVDEARRYYIGIVGKYGAQVLSLLKKAAALDVARICPLHGPVLSGDLSLYLNLYTKWASYTPEEDGVTIAYTSIYGNTAAAAKLLLDELGARGVKAELFDLARCDKAEAIASAFKYSKLVLASSTYNAGVFPPMREFIAGLVERNFSSRTVGFIENGSWAPTAAKVMRASLEMAKSIKFIDKTVTVNSALNASSEAGIRALAAELKEV